MLNYSNFMCHKIENCRETCTIFQYNFLENNYFISLHSLRKFSDFPKDCEEFFADKERITFTVTVK